MADIARGLGLSARSFHRRLSEHGMSFQTLTEETRRELAALSGRTDGEPVRPRYPRVTPFHKTQLILMSP